MTTRYEYTLINQTQAPLVVDTKFTEDLALRRTIPANGSIVLPAGQYKLEDMDFSSELRDLIDQGLLRVTIKDGPVVFRQQITPRDLVDTGTRVTVLSDIVWPYEVRPLWLFTHTMEDIFQSNTYQLQLNGVDYGTVPGTNFIRVTLVRPFLGDSEGYPAIIRPGDVFQVVQSAGPKPLINLNFAAVRVSL